MRVALIGSGGREHALARAISKSSELNKLFILPGNPGTAQLGQNIELNISDHDAVTNFCLENIVKLVVIGPEQPLVEGLADKLREKGISVFGPSKTAAMLEGSKRYSKEFMLRHSIPTADFKSFKVSEMKEALNYLETISYPTVIKTSGLAAGKGVAICENKNSAHSTILDYFENDKFGESGHNIVIEEFMEGEEASIFVICDGKDYVILPTSQDHKRVFDGDEGPNTGGMGAYSPAPVVTARVNKHIENDIIIPTVNGLISDGTPYIGCIYIGVMIKDGNAKVVEYNCRFGDPEAQVVLPNLEGDFLRLISTAANGVIDKDAIHESGAASLCVVAASGGYPGKYQKGKEIKGFTNSENGSYVYHAGTKLIGEKLVTNGGRVFAVTYTNKKGDLNDCKQKVYQFLDNVYFEGIHYREDIGYRAFQ